MAARTAILSALGAAAFLGAASPWVSPPIRPAALDDAVAGPVAAVALDVIDGDTIVVRARIWLGQDVETRVRLAGADAPELKGRCERERRLAIEAREFVRGRVMREGLSLRDVRYDKYGRRVLARVVTADGEDLADTLIRQGLARAYGGGARGDWCGESEPRFERE